MYVVRCADDFVCFFQYENEAKAFYEALKERLAKFGLELSEEKSRIMRFGRFAKQHSKDGKTERFGLLGFTLINGMMRTGKYRVVYRTSKKKLKAKKHTVKEWPWKSMHGKLSNTIEELNRKFIGHYAYYGICGNWEELLKFYRFIVIVFYKALIRRS